MADLGARGAVAVLLLVLAGCGTDRSTGTPGAGPAASPTDSATASPPLGMTAGPTATTPTPTSSEWGQARTVLDTTKLHQFYAGADEAVLSADGSRVAFAGTNTDVMVVTVANGALINASTASDGTAADYALDDPGEGDTIPGGSTEPALSADGRTVAFASSAVNLVPQDTNRTGDSGSGTDIFVKNLRTGTLMRATTTKDGGQATGESGAPSLSGDGRWVAFSSTAANLVDGDTNGVADVFLKDVAGGGITRISLDASGAQLAAASGQPVLSDDGSTIAFVTDAAAVEAARKGHAEVVVKNLRTGALIPVVRSATVKRNGVHDVSMTRDGKMVAFVTSGALLPVDTNRKDDLYLRDLRTGLLSAVSVGTGKDAYDLGSISGAVSPDGSTAVFTAVVFTDRRHLHARPELWVVDPAGGHRKSVARGTYVRHPMLAGDGSRLTFLDGDRIGVVDRRGH